MVKAEQEHHSELCPMCLGIGVAKRMRRGLEEMMPEGFREHLRNARKEQLLAVRSVVDAAIDRLEEKPKKGARASKVQVQ